MCVWVVGRGVFSGVVQLRRRAFVSIVRKRTRNVNATFHNCRCLKKITFYTNSSYVVARSGELRTQKSKSHLVRTQSLNVLSLNPGVGQYIAIHDTLTARDFFLANFYPSGPFTCIFSKPLSKFSCVGCG